MSESKSGTGLKSKIKNFLYTGLGFLNTFKSDVFDYKPTEADMFEPHLKGIKVNTKALDKEGLIIGLGASGAGKSAFEYIPASKERSRLYELSKEVNNQSLNEETELIPYEKVEVAGTGNFYRNGSECLPKDQKDKIISLARKLDDKTATLYARNPDKMKNYLRSNGVDLNNFDKNQEFFSYCTAVSTTGKFVHDDYVFPALDDMFLDYLLKEENAGLKTGELLKDVVIDSLRSKAQVEHIMELCDAFDVPYAGAIAASLDHDQIMVRTSGRMYGLNEDGEYKVDYNLTRDLEDKFFPAKVELKDKKLKGYDAEGQPLKVRADDLPEMIGRRLGEAKEFNGDAMKYASEKGSLIQFPGSTLMYNPVERANNVLGAMTNNHGIINSYIWQSNQTLENLVSHQENVAQATGVNLIEYAKPYLSKGFKFDPAA